MDKNYLFQQECKKRVESYPDNKHLMEAAKFFINETIDAKYSYNFSWMGRPIIQYPQDIIAMQEIIWEVKPDLIIETGIAHGGSLIFYSSMLELLGGDGEVIGVDIDIRPHNRLEIESHSMFKRIILIEGPSTDEKIINQINEIAKTKKSVMVVLDSNHTHEHVLRELNLYSPFVTIGNYCVVLDTIIEDLPENTYNDRPWGKGNNPKTAVFEFLKDHQEFIIDKSIEDKLIITVAPKGYLKKIR